MSKVFDFLRTVIMPVSKADEKPKYVPGQPTPHRHYSVEEQQRRNSGWLQNCGAWERMHGSGRW
jgi:hypothetical protein